ncbi:MAG TPA: NAD(P)H-hydrate dehydratase, partial [Dehalococcoidales bacterium]|nr:NAD(P)H-hydrate dehydratase [Dehalococcoidales bacterium]
MKVCRVGEIRHLDRQAIEDYGIPAEILMENAGHAVCDVIRRETGIAGKKFVVLCGPGNNGGDGFVVARHLHAGGADVTVLIVADRTKYRGESLKNLEILTRFPLKIIDATSVRQIANQIKQADILIDALLGTGLDRNVAGLLAGAIAGINNSGKPVFSVDIPSGVNGNNGMTMGTAVKADYTITFGLPKIGNLFYPGFELGGKLFVSPISYPKSISESTELKIELTPAIPLPERKANSNKFSYGPALVIAGAANYFWAPHASTYSFLKSGGGYVHLACPTSIAASVAKKGQEVVIQPMAETETGSISLENKAKLLELAEKMKIVVIGPGLSLNPETQQLVRELVTSIEKPVVIDGDGLTAIAAKPEILSKRHAPTILTPHTGELSRITGIKSEEIEHNRIDILQQTAAKLNSYIAFKGSRTLVGCPDGRIFINTSGSTGGKAGMATAGSGDVLNGTIAATYCLGLNIEHAVLVGVMVHGLAGDIAAEKQGPDGMTAQDILNSLPAAVKFYRGFNADLAEN